MPSSKLILRMPAGFRFENRAIGFLEGEGWLDAGKAFDDLGEKEQETVRNRVDHWLQGGIFKKYHHGFDAPKHRDCYVFKFQSLRLYGFLCNAKPKTDPRFRLGVLTSCAEKHQWNTEESFLDLAMKMRADTRSKEAIAAIYSEYYKGCKSWTN